MPRLSASPAIALACVALLSGVAACTVRTTGPTTPFGTSGAGARVPREIFVPGAAMRVEGGRLFAEIWARGVGGSDAPTGGARALLFGAGVVSPSREMGCRTHTGGIQRCSPFSTSSSSHDPGRFSLRPEQGWELDLTQAAAGAYRMDVAEGPEVLARVEIPLVSLPAIAGGSALTVSPAGRAGMAYATGERWTAWIPVDGRFSGTHAITIAWYHDGRRVSELEGSFEGPYASRDERTREVLDTPVVELLPFDLGRMPEVTVNVGTYTALVIFDHRVVAGSWNVSVASGPMVERHGRVGMLYEVSGATVFEPAHGEPSAFWGEIAATQPDPSMVSDALTIAPRLSAVPEPQDEAIVCAIASEPRAREWLQEEPRSARGRGAHGTAADPMARFRAAARRFRAGCLSDLVGPEIAPALLAVP